MLVEHTKFDKMAENPSVNYEHWNDLGLRNKKEARFMRKGKVGDWKNHFSDPMLEDFNRWEKKNNRTNVIFEYELKQ